MSEERGDRNYETGDISSLNLPKPLEPLNLELLNL